MFRRMGAAVVGAGSLYIAPFLPSPQVWPSALARLTSSASDSSEHAVSVPTRTVSVVVPVYGEGASELRATLVRLYDNTDAKDRLEIVVVDANPSTSMDMSSTSLRAVLSKAQVSSMPLLTNLSVLSSQSGRGQALDTGARAAKGDLLLFLHADTELPRGYDSAVRGTLQDANVLLTAFRFEVDKRSVASDFASALQRLETSANLRSQWLWLPYGDQALAMSRASYEAVHGFKRVKLMEDFDLVTRVRHAALSAAGPQRPRITILPEAAQCSPRRWERHGVVKNTCRNWLFVAAFVLAGVEPDRLYDLYYGA